MDRYLTPVTQTSVKKSFAKWVINPGSTEVHFLDPRVGARTPPAPHVVVCSQERRNAEARSTRTPTRRSPASQVDHTVFLNTHTSDLEHN